MTRADRLLYVAAWLCIAVVYAGVIVSTWLLWGIP